MQSKEKILKDCKYSERYGWAITGIMDVEKHYTYDEMALKAREIHARNFAVEFTCWYNNLPKVDAERIVNEFMQSDYLKERTEG